ncbi:unnamed protein product [Urochloa humidicola]
MSSPARSVSHPWSTKATLLFGTTIGVLGMAVITLSVTISGLKPSACSSLAQQAGTCVAPSALHRGVLYAGMDLMVVFTGGLNPTSLPFAADQFDEHDMHQKGALRRFYNLYYTITMEATFLALTIVVYLQVKVSWSLGFAISTALMTAAFVVFLASAAFYVSIPPEGSIFSSVARVFVASFRKGRLPLPHPDDARRQEVLLYKYVQWRRWPHVLQQAPIDVAAQLHEQGIHRDGRRRGQSGRVPVEAVEPVQRATGGGSQVPREGNPRVDLRHAVVHRDAGAEQLHVYTLLQAFTMDMGRHFTIPAVSILTVALFMAHCPSTTCSLHEPRVGSPPRTRHHVAPEAGHQVGGRRGGVRGGGHG